MNKILCLIDGLGSGGAQKQLAGLATLLKNKGYDVTFVWYHNKDFFRPVLEENNITCIKLSSGQKFLKIWEIAKIIRKNNIDVVISYLGGPSITSCLLKAFGLKVKVIVSERNTTQKLTWYNKMKFFLYRFADKIVPNSYSQERFLKKNYPQYSDKIQTITNFLDNSKYKVRGNWIKPKCLNILTVGRINPQKNLLRYLQSVAKIKETGVSVHFHWYGRHDQDVVYWDKVSAVYKELELVDILTFHEPDYEIEKRYYEADAFLLPSIYEGFPNVVCEAMSSGLPILCSNVCDNGDIVEDQKNGFLFDPASVDDIFEKIMAFCSLEQEKILEFRDQSRKLAIAKFDKNKFIDSYIKLIEE